MKVALVVPGFSADAADWCIPVLVDVVRELSRRVDLHVFALRYPYRRDRYRLHGAFVHALGGGTARSRQRAGLLAGAFAALAAEHRRGRFDALHGLWVDEPGFVAAVAGRLLAVPTVASVMGGELVALPAIEYGGRLTASGRLLAAITLRGAGRITAGCTGGVALARRSLPASHHAKVVRLPNGVDAGLFDDGAPPVQLAGELRLLHVASLLPVKDQATLLQTMAQLKRAEPGAHLHVAGDGPLRPDLQRQAATLGLADAVTFHGAISRRALPAYYRAADVLAVSSRHEGQLVVALEAGLSGLPIAGTAVGLVADFAPKAAIAVPVGDSAGLAAALVALRAPAARQALGAAAQSLVRSEYLASQTAARLVALYAGTGHGDGPG